MALALISCQQYADYCALDSWQWLNKGIKYYCEMKMPTTGNLTCPLLIFISIWVRNYYVGRASIAPQNVVPIHKPAIHPPPQQQLMNKIPLKYPNFNTVRLAEVLAAVGLNILTTTHYLLFCWHINRKVGCQLCFSSSNDIQ